MYMGENKIVYGYVRVSSMEQNEDSDAVSRYMSSNKDNIINDITNTMIDNGMDVKDDNVINNVANDVVNEYLDKWLMEKPVPTKQPVVTKEPIPTKQPVVTAKPVVTKRPKITITTKTKKIKKGKTLKLTAKKQNISGKIKWKSSNKKVAKVSNTGKVTAKKKGKATITAYIGKVKASIKKPYISN